MTDKARELLERAYQYIPMSSITSQEIRSYLAEPEVKREEIVTDLIQALETMLVATTKTNEEQFVGHHAAYLETVAKPRAKAALDKARNEK